MVQLGKLPNDNFEKPLLLNLYCKNIWKQFLIVHI